MNPLAGKIQEKLKAGELQITPEKKIPTFGEYAQKWLSGYGETSLKYSTYKGYDSIMRAHLGPLMDRPLNQITRPELKEMIYGKEGLAPATVTRIKALISVILSHAFEDDLIPLNPASGLSRLIKCKDRKSACPHFDSGPRHTLWAGNSSYFLELTRLIHHIKYGGEGGMLTRSFFS